MTCTHACILIGSLVALSMVSRTRGAAPATEAASAAVDEGSERVFVDREGVIRWSADRGEVALFGVNYCLPSACDYRAAGYVGVDRKKLIDQDLAHLSRMGFDAVRVCFWGDWENTDKDGKLLVNDHLDVMDYLVAQASRRGMSMLFSPIVTYSSIWPDLQEDKSVIGFSTHFKKSELGTNPEAIAAQQRYLRELLNHVNPYTGIPLKDEPNILFIEMINEPWHHSKDAAGSVKYIDALVEAVRSTGCAKPTFHNLSQDFGMADPIRNSKVDGLTFAWYPSGLNANHALRGNFLRYVDDYPPMLAPAVPSKPRLVYEFDMPDVNSGYHYPAMVRAFRQAGAQLATMFSYDMVATAPYNLGWHTHLLNLVYTPQKAASAVIAARAMKLVPRMTSYGSYPENCRFGSVRVSYEQNLAELVTREEFMYSNDTTTSPPAPAELRGVVGFGSSPVVHYGGRGIYFLDRIDAGRWRLEVYPDSLEVSDPFHQPNKDTLKFRLIARTHEITVKLPDLGDSFAVRPLNAGNAHEADAVDGRFTVRPGAYVLSAPSAAKSALPERVAGRISLKEFVCPSPEQVPPSARLTVPREHVAGRPMPLHALIADYEEPASVAVRTSDGQTCPMQLVKPYEYQCEVPTDTMKEGPQRVSIVVRTGADEERALAEGETTLVAPNSPITLFEPARDVGFLSESRDGWAPNSLVLGSAGGAEAVHFGFDAKMVPEDLTRSLFIGDSVRHRRDDVPRSRFLSIVLRGRTQESVVHVTLVDKNGAAWAAPVKAGTTWTRANIALSEFRRAKWVLLPQSFPAGLSYWCESAGEQSMFPNLADLERLQFSLRKADVGAADAKDFGVEVERVTLEFSER